MVYFYAALSVVMMTGIMAVIEMGLTLTSQSLILKPPSLGLKTSIMDTLKGHDKIVLSLLYEPNLVQGLDPLGSPVKSPLKSSELCAQIISSLKSVDKLAAIDVSNTSPSGVWSNSCALELENPELKKRYRFLIQPNALIDEKFPYNLFSCVLDDRASPSSTRKCNFESNS